MENLPEKLTFFEKLVLLQNAVCQINHSEIHHSEHPAGGGSVFQPLLCITAQNKDFVIVLTMGSRYKMSYLKSVNCSNCYSIMDTTSQLTNLDSVLSRQHCILLSHVCYLYHPQAWRHFSKSNWGRTISLTRLCTSYCTPVAHTRLTSYKWNILFISSLDISSVFVHLKVGRRFMSAISWFKLPLKMKLNEWSGERALMAFYWKR